MAVQLPTPGEEPWGEELNAAINSIDSRLVVVESGVGGGGVTDHGMLSGLADNDHPQYQVVSQKGIASGYASLGTDGKVPTGQLPTSSSGGTLPADLSGSWYAGRYWYSLGTSITIDGSYTNKLRDASGMVLFNKGASGGTLSTASNGTIWNALVNQVGTDAEVITIETINDFRLNVPLGTIGDVADPSVSYYGALSAACEWTLFNRPAARLFFLTAYGDAYTGGYPNGATPNANGDWYFDFNDAMHKVGSVYGVPVLKVGEESGINYYTCQFFTTDMIHMNANGGTRYTEYVWAKMRSMGWMTSRPTAPGAASPVPVTGVSIVQGSVVAIAPTQTMQLSASITPSNASNKGVTWSTSDATKVTVSLDGLITGVATGSANITVTTADGGFTSVCSVTCANAAVSSVAIAPKTFTLLPFETQQLTPTVLPSNATNKAVTYASNATGVATVNSSGLVTAVANGSATITVTTVDQAKTDTAVATVSSTVPVTGVDLVPASISVVLGGTSQLTATVLPANATNKTVTYASDNTGVATVNSSGLVTPVAAGSAIITVTTTDGSKTDTTAVTVAASDWNLRKATAYVSLGVTGLTVDGNNDPTWSGTTWAYPVVFFNDILAGDNACEFVTTGSPGPGGWVVVGTDGETCFAAIGDINPGITLEAVPSAAGLGSTSPATGPDYIINSPAGPLSNGVKFRMARVGDMFHCWKWSGTVWTEITRVDLSGANPSVIAYKGLGLMIGGSYSKVRDVWTGTYLAGAQVPLTGISVDQPTLGITVGGTSGLSVTYSPANATNKSMSWSSNTPSVATVNAAGTVTGVSVGTATITGTSVDGNFTDTCVVTVTNPASEWALSAQTVFRDNNLNGVTATGSDPTYTSVTAGTYGALLINTPGQNAIEFTIANGANGLWLVHGTHATDGNFVGFGDLTASGITTNGVFTGGGIGLIGISPAQSTSPAYATGKVYRLGRSGTRVKLVRVDPGPTLVTIWDGDLATNFPSNAAWYANLDLGVMQNSSYSLVTNCKTGSWTPA